MGIALSLNTTGIENTAAGNGALFSNTSGGGNVAVGRWALAFNTTGLQNTAIGYYSGNGSVHLYNTTAIGNNATCTADNRIILGTTGNNNLTGGYGNWQNLSDGRFKRNVKADVPGLAFITRLRPVTYHLDAEGVDRFLGITARMDTWSDGPARKLYFDRLREVGQQVLTGFVAQEVEAAAREIHYDFDGVHHPATEQDHYTLGYASFVVPLVKAVQEQQAQIEELKERVRVLEGR